MEKFIIQYEIGNTSHTAEVIAADQEQAEMELANSMRQTRRRYRITDIIPEGIVAGFEVVLVDIKTMEI